MLVLHTFKNIIGQTLGLFSRLTDSILFFLCRSKPSAKPTGSTFINYWTKNYFYFNTFSICFTNKARFCGGFSESLISKSSLRVKTFTLPITFWYNNDGHQFRSRRWAAFKRKGRFLAPLLSNASTAFQPFHCERRDSQRTSSPLSNP